MTIKPTVDEQIGSILDSFPCITLSIREHILDRATIDGDEILKLADMIDRYAEELSGLLMHIECPLLPLSAWEAALKRGEAVSPFRFSTAYNGTVVVHENSGEYLWMYGNKVSSRAWTLEALIEDSEQYDDVAVCNAWCVDNRGRPVIIER